MQQATLKANQFILRIDHAIKHDPPRVEKLIRRAWREVDWDHVGNHLRDRFCELHAKSNGLKAVEISE